MFSFLAKAALVVSLVVLTGCSPAIEPFYLYRVAPLDLSGCSNVDDPILISRAEDAVRASGMGNADLIETFNLGMPLYSRMVDCAERGFVLKTSSIISTDVGYWTHLSRDLQVMKIYDAW